MRTRVLHCLGGDHAGIKIVRFDASLNFSNSDFFETRVRQKLLPCTRVLVVDGSSINDLDITAVRMLQRLCGYLRQRDTLLLFANWKGPMRDFLQRTAFYTALPPEFCFLSLQDAVYYAQAYIRHRQLRLKHQPQQPKMIEGYPVARTTHNPAAPSEPFYWRGQQQEEEEGKNEEQQVQQLEEVRLQHQERSHQEKQDEWQQGQLEATVVKRPLLMHQFQEKHVSRVSVDAISVKRCYLPCSRFESPEDADVGVADALFEGAQSVQRGRRGRGSGVREEQDREKDEEVNKQLTAHGGKTDFSEALSNRSSHPGKSADGENSSSMSTAAGLSLCLDRTSYSSMNNATGSRRSLNVLPVDHRRTPTKQSRHFAVGSAAVLRTAVSESSALETKTPDATTLRLEVNATSPVTTFPSSLASPKSYSMCKKKSSQPLPAAGGRLERNSRRRKGSDGSESVKLPVTDCWCATPEDRKGDPVSLHRTAENSLGCKNACQLRPRPAQNETAFLPRLPGRYVPDVLPPVLPLLSVILILQCVLLVAAVFMLHGWQQRLHEKSVDERCDRPGCVSKSPPPPLFNVQHVAHDDYRRYRRSGRKGGRAAAASTKLTIKY